MVVYSEPISRTRTGLNRTRKISAFFGIQFMKCLACFFCQAFLENHPIELKELRTSTGAEIRFIMPVLNVPFRLIYAWNPQRDSFQPKSAFKFAVGTTF